MADLKTHKVNMRGKEYLMVSGRVLLAHDTYQDDNSLSIMTSIIYEDDTIIRIQATVVTPKGTFTGYAESDKIKGEGVERVSPLEVAETSAVGRALGFAGLGVEGGIATADEIEKAQAREARQKQAEPAARPANARSYATEKPATPSQAVKAGVALVCADCDATIADTAVQGGMMKAADVAAGTKQAYGRELCVSCAAKARAKR